MNRRIRNRTSGGVGGRRGQPLLLPDPASGKWLTGRQQPVVLVLGNAVAFAGSLFQSRPVQDGHLSPFVLDQPCSLKHARDQADGRRYSGKLTFSGGVPRVSVSRTDNRGAEIALGYAPVKWRNVVPTGHLIYIEISVTA